MPKTNKWATKLKRGGKKKRKFSKKNKGGPARRLLLLQPNHNTQPFLSHFLQTPIPHLSSPSPPHYSVNPEKEESEIQRGSESEIGGDE